MTSLITAPPLWLHGIIFNTIWALFVVFYWPVVATLLTCVWLALLTPRQFKGTFLILIWLFGITADFLFITTGYFQFQGSYFNPIWLIILWLAFANFSALLLRQFTLPTIAWAVIFGLGGPFSYWLAQWNQALQIQWHLWPYTICLLVFWSGLIPLTQQCVNPSKNLEQQ